MKKTRIIYDIASKHEAEMIQLHMGESMLRAPIPRARGRYGVRLPRMRLPKNSVSKAAAQTGVSPIAPFSGE